MQSELQTALFQAFDTLNLQRVKTFSVPPVTLCGPGAVSSCGQQAQTRGLKHLFVAHFQLGPYSLLHHHNGRDLKMLRHVL